MNDIYYGPIALLIILTIIVVGVVIDCINRRRKQV